MSWHERSETETLKELNARREGLTAQEAEARQQKYGKNQLQGAKKRSVAQMLLAQMKDTMVLILLTAAMISGFALGEWTDCGIILLVVALNAVLGVVQEQRAENAMEALKKISSPCTRVARRSDACPPGRGIGARRYCCAGSGEIWCLLICGCWRPSAYRCRKAP